MTKARKILTTIGRKHGEEILLRGGADAFLTKPVKGPDLVKKVRELLGDD